MTSDELNKAILSLVPGAQFSLREGQIEWYDSRPLPKLDALNREVAKLKEKALRDDIKAECKRQIRKILKDDITYVNIVAEAVKASENPNDPVNAALLTDYKSLLLWLSDMRYAGRNIPVNTDPTTVSWPVASAEIIELVKRF